ncbi:unnamed protein product, partial [Mesorhabditis belari]|uniref:Uncharacterized protein n=1 Tax=Mesorhabditis belari TaxID=2138241 RepID=A0AAF3J445_9BILA
MTIGNQTLFRRKLARTSVYNVPTIQVGCFRQTQTRKLLVLKAQRINPTPSKSHSHRYWILWLSGCQFYGCSPEEVYLFVKGPKTFLQSNDRFLVFSIEQLTHNITIPCRTTVMITEAKVRLFVNDVEWREWCRLNSVVANCLELRYDARVGFMLPAESFFMDNLDWINQNRFKCEYEKEETEFLVQVTQQMSLDHPVGIDKLNCTLNGKYTLFMDSYGSRLNVSCPECHLNMSLRIFGLFHDERFLEKIALLKRLPTNHMQHFCDWLEALVNGGNDHEFPFEVIPKDTQETVFLNFLEGPTISDIVRYFTPISIILIAFLLCCALLLISLCGYIYCPRKRTAGASDFTELTRLTVSGATEGDVGDGRWDSEEEDPNMAKHWRGKLKAASIKSKVPGDLQDFHEILSSISINFNCKI